MYPVLIGTWLHFSELEAREGMECKPAPILPGNYKIANEETLCCSCEIQDSNDFIDLASADWTDWT